MAQTIDLKTTTLVVQPSKTVKFANVMGGAQGAGGKNVSFANKEYANVAKTVVLVGQSLKKLNVNVRDMKKLMLEEKTFRKQQLARELRREREERIERSRGGRLGVRGAASAAAGASKSLLERLLAPLTGLGQILTGMIGGPAIEKLLDSNFVRNAVTGLVNMVRAITDAIGNVPDGLGGKVGNALKRLFQFVGNFVGGSIGRAIEGLDKILKPDGTFKFSLDGIFKLVTGLGGLALTFRYLKNPTRIIKDVGSVLNFLVRGIGGLARMIPNKLKLPGLGGAASAIKGGAGNAINAVKGAPGAIRGGVQSVGDFFTRNRAAVNWGGPPTSTMPGVTRGARAISEYGQGAVQAGLRNTPRALAGGARGLMSGARGLMGGIGGAAKAGFTKIGTRIPILGSLLAGGMEFAQSGDLGKAGGAGVGAGLGTAIGAGIGSVIPGAGTLVGGLAGGIIGEFIGKTIGGGITEMFEGFNIGEVVFKPVMDAFKVVGDALKEPIDMLMKAFGISKDGKAEESGFIKALKTVGKVIGIIAKVLLKGIAPVMNVIASTLKYAIKVVTSVVGGLAKLVGDALGAIGGFLSKIGIPMPGGNMLANISSMIDGIDTSDWGKFARGGKIFGGKPTGDSVPAFLERGEYVMNRNAVRAIGPGNLDRMNFGMFPRYQSGGMIVTSRMGNRGFALSPGMHMGVDIAPASGKSGAPLQAFTDGVVEATSPPSPSAGYGNWINWVDKDGVGHLYAHMMNAPTVRAGTRVKKGTILGYLGNTGRSSGPHLHWETATNPRDTGMPKSAVLSRFNPLSKYGKNAPFGGSITPDPGQSPRGPFTPDTTMMASAPSSSSFSGITGSSLAPTANGTSAAGMTAEANIKFLTASILNLMKPLKESGLDLGAPVPQMAQQNTGGSAEPLVSAANSAGSIMNNLYEMFSAGGNG